MPGVRVQHSRVKGTLRGGAAAPCFCPVDGGRGSSVRFYNKAAAPRKQGRGALNIKYSLFRTFFFSGKSPQSIYYQWVPGLFCAKEVYLLPQESIPTPTKSIPTPTNFLLCIDRVIVLVFPFMGDGQFMG